MNDAVMNAIQQSPMWVKLNQSVKGLYEQNNREPSEEEYAALRTMMICKVMLEDANVKEIVCSETYKELRGEAKMTNQPKPWEPMTEEEEANERDWGYGE